MMTGLVVPLAVFLLGRRALPWVDWVHLANEFVARPASFISHKCPPITTQQDRLMLGGRCRHECVIDCAANNVLVCEPQDKSSMGFGT